MNDAQVRLLSRRPLTVVSAVFVALAIGFTIGVAQAADQRLDEAQLGLQKVQALLEAAQPGGVPEKAQRKFERHRSRALHHVERSMEQIDAAKDAVDNPD